MEPISNADRLVTLLRLKLEERAKSTGGSRAAAGTKPNASSPAEPSGIRALAAIEGADERSLRRAVIQNLLADQFDAGLINDAQFQQIVTRVTEAIEEDPKGAGLLSRVIAELRSS
jgi:hypothetical protein